MRPPLRPDAETSPHPSRLGADHPRRDEIMARHGAAVAAGHETYLDPATGLSVMTAARLVERGWCCDSGCRHCPYVGTTDKGAWRTWARAALSTVDLAAASVRVRDHLRPVLGRIGGPERILVYRALATEIDLAPLVDDLGPERFAVTRTHGDDPLTVHGAEEPSERHAYGFDQPAAGAPELDVTAIAVALVPGLAFDGHGTRLGRGGGHYDRLLAGMAPRTPMIGVVPVALVVPDLPREGHDIPMTHLATEAGITAVGPPGAR